MEIWLNFRIIFKKKKLTKGDEIAAVPTATASRSAQKRKVAACLLVALSMYSTVPRLTSAYLGSSVTLALYETRGALGETLQIRDTPGCAPRLAHVAQGC